MGERDRERGREKERESEGEREIDLASTMPIIKSSSKKNFEAGDLFLGNRASPSFSPSLVFGSMASFVVAGKAEDGGTAQVRG